MLETFSLKINPEGESRPTCDEDTRGMVWTDVSDVAGEGDEVLFCIKNNYDEFQWQDVVSLHRPIEAYGGDGVYEFTGDGTNGVLGQSYRVHKFTTIGDSDFVIEYAPTGGSVDVFLVGGGGGGGSYGGGGGGLVWEQNYLVSSGESFAVTVGDGGTGRSGYGLNGEDSAFNELIALGGGGGGGHGSSDYPGSGQDGESGGGAGARSEYGKGDGLQSGTLTGGYGNDGGGYTTDNMGGGGGGAESSGQDGTSSSAGNMFERSRIIPPISNFPIFSRPIRRRVAPQSRQARGFRALRARPNGGSTSLAILSICFAQLLTKRI